jgi:hypothetical protein
MKRTTYTYIIMLAALLGVTQWSCKKIDEARPDDTYTEEDAIKTPADVQMLLNSCYDAFANQMNGKAQTFNDLMSDDLAKPLKDDAGFKNEIYNRNTNIFNSDVGDLYRNLYLIPFRVNTLTDFYDKVGVSASERLRIEAEGKFLRAACHFEVVKLWAQPPGFTFGNEHRGIVVRDVVSQLPKARSTVAQTYEFIISDLSFAIENLPDVNGNYATKNAARALLAKVYYMLNRPADALPLLNTVIANTNGGNLSATLNRFDNVAAQSEYIFATISTNASTDNRGGEFIGKYRCDTKQPDFVISKELYTMLTTDTTDKRGKTLVQVFNPGKDNEFYGVNKFNKDFFGVPYLHLTDMLLLRAELLAEGGGDMTTAIGDVNKVIARAYQDSTTKMVPGGSLPSVVLTEVRKQRRLEFFCEGDRVQTLKRQGGKGEANVFIRNAPWNCPGMVLQFPSVETGQGFEFNASGGCN